MLKNIWNSPTLMTWMSYSTKALALLGVLPLVVKNFAPGDIVVWYLFSTIITLQSFADFGFRATFSRFISYAFNGAKDIKIMTADDNDTDGGDGANKPLLNRIMSTQYHIYVWLTLVLVILFSVFGTWSLIKPIHDTTSVTQSWYAWGVVILVTCFSFYGKIYSNFLEGLNKIALVRRIETFTSLGSILTSILVLVFKPTLLNLVIANQFWMVVVTIRDWYLCHRVENGIYKEVSVKLPFEKEMFTKIWQPAWRSGISSLMSVGLTNLTGLVYAQVGSTGEIASYLLAMRIINQIKEVSMAPFYSKIPVLARLRLKNDMAGLIKVVKRGMFLSHIVYVVSFVIIGLFSSHLLTMIHSKVAFVDQRLWILLGVAFFIHRYGAMHMQLYLSTNHIISHIADGISGVLYIAASILLAKSTGIYSIPLGMLVGYLGFYAWYAAMYSYRSIKMTFWNLEKSASLVPILLILMFITFEVCMGMKSF